MQDNNKTLPELLVPVGGREQFDAACIYGADAVYLGGDGLNLRKASHGFTKEELEQAVIDAHLCNVEVYYCLNALPFDGQINDVRDRLKSLGETDKEKQVDALIIADAGVFALAREICPEIPIHLSTQAHTVNCESIKFWQSQGATRVNLARELNFKQISEISSSVNIELEVFMHGAMCLALSGHCLLSMWSNNRVANHGFCSQPCRFQYKGKELSVRETSLDLIESTRTDNVLWTAEEDEDFSTIWAPHEQCLIRYITFLKQNKIASLKIEGRTKSPSYVAQVADIYKTALNRTLLNSKEKAALPYSIKDLINELASVATRPLSTGFFLPERRIEAEVQKKNKKIVARVLEKIKDGAWLIDVRAQWKEERDAQVLVPNFIRPSLGKYSFENHKGEKVDTVHSGTKAILYSESLDIKEHYYIQTI